MFTGVRESERIPRHETHFPYGYKGMISKQEFESVVTSASDALKPGADFAWIRESAILERAYYIGLYAGLKAIAQEEDLDRLLRRALFETVFMRSGDDSFSSTPVGKAYEELKKSFLDNKDPEQFTQLIRALLTKLDEIDRSWNSALFAARRIIEELNRLKTKSDSANANADSRNLVDEIISEGCRLFEMLEQYLRVVSLIQTDHRKWRFLLD